MIDPLTPTTQKEGAAAHRFDPEGLLSRRFPVERRTWDAAQAVRWARDLGAGLPGDMAAFDGRFLDPAAPLALPMIAVPLCDGEFWQQRPETGIDWRRLVHAEEVMTLHRPLPAAGGAIVSQAIVDLRDRGADKGAQMLQRFSLDDPQGTRLADIDVSTVLRGNGGFGGAPPDARRAEPLPERAPDVVIDLRTPAAGDTSFCLAVELKLAAGGTLRPEQKMMRGVASFGMAGRGALALACDNDPTRLRRFGVRYGGPMFSDETMRLELWRTGAGRAVLRMHAVERASPVLSYGFIEGAD